MYSDLRNLGFNPYAPEFSQLIREGKASRFYWRIMGPIVNFMIRRQVFLGRHVKKSFEWLDLKPSDLRITRGHHIDRQHYDSDACDDVTAHPLSA
jgi:hypothetical protein